MKLSLTPIITNEESPLSYSTDLLYAGLLRKILNKCYQDCVKEVFCICNLFQHCNKI